MRLNRIEQKNRSVFMRNDASGESYPPMGVTEQNSIERLNYHTEKSATMLENTTPAKMDARRSIGNLNLLRQKVQRMLLNEDSERTL